MFKDWRTNIPPHRQIVFRQFASLDVKLMWHEGISVYVNLLAILFFCSTDLTGHSQHQVFSRFVETNVVHLVRKLSQCFYLPPEISRTLWCCCSKSRVTVTLTRERSARREEPGPLQNNDNRHFRGTIHLLPQK